jgi:hypothetical protein
MTSAVASAPLILGLTGAIVGGTIGIVHDLRDQRKRLERTAMRTYPMLSHDNHIGRAFRLLSFYAECSPSRWRSLCEAAERFLTIYNMATCHASENNNHTKKELRRIHAWIEELYRLRYYIFNTLQELFQDVKTWNHTQTENKATMEQKQKSRQKKTAWRSFLQRVVEAGVTFHETRKIDAVLSKLFMEPGDKTAVESDNIRTATKDLLHLDATCQQCVRAIGQANRDVVLMYPEYK